ncbi:MAG TPA: DoxX family protein [Phycisphaerales bacterium]|nr:DoxX family protein [Phycisphaerales bacterium]
MQRPAGSSIAPIFLRIAIGVTFVWAGLGKLEGEMRVSGEPAAILANMGLHIARKNAQPAAPAERLPGETPALAPVPPTSTPPVPGELPAAGPVPGGGGSDASQAPPRDVPVPQPVLADGQSVGSDAANQQAAPASITTAPAAKAARGYVAQEFPKDFEVKRVYGLALMLHRASHPAPRADASMPGKLWPDRFGRGTWPLFFAWSAAVLEVVGGVFVLAGLLTRASAAGLAGVMLGAMWLTEVGPAVQAGTTVLGFIPDRDWLAVDQWKTVFWQFSLMMGALALAFLGSGALGLDRKLFPPIPPAPTNVKPMI